MLRLWLARIAEADAAWEASPPAFRGVVFAPTKVKNAYMAFDFKLNDRWPPPTTS